jgi:O-antigen/teichoic acid export membrane protein
MTSDVHQAESGLPAGDGGNGPAGGPAPGNLQCGSQECAGAPIGAPPGRNLRRSLLFATVGRYVVTATGVISTVILARLLTPSAFGISVLGTAVLAIAEAIRELGSIAYLVQQKDLTLAKVRTVFSISLTVTLVIAALLMALSQPLAGLLDAPGLAAYIRIIALSYAIAPFAHPVYALLSRDMAFATLAGLDILTTAANTIVAIYLVRVGFGYLGIAWAAVISNAVWTVSGFCVRRDVSIYRPSLSEWRSVLSFGAYGSATALLYKASESLFYLMLGGLLDARAVALCQRAVLLSQFPERVILAGVGAVALPAFSELARHGKDLKAAYLGAIEHITVIQWPALILLGIFARPIVALLLGPQWESVVVITRIFAFAFAFNFPTGLNYPLQVAVGAIRQTVTLAIIQTAVSLATLVFAAQYGLVAVALTACLTTPLSVALSVRLVRRHIAFRWRDLPRAVWRSAAVAGSSAVGPVAIAAACDGRAVAPATLLGSALLAAAVGWIGGLWLVRHPLFQELAHAFTSMLGVASVKRSSNRLRLDSP